jgi:hypothetical protein
MNTSSYESSEHYKIDNKLHSNGVYQANTTFGLGPYYALNRKEQKKIEKDWSKEELEKEIENSIYYKNNIFSQSAMLDSIDNFINIQHKYIYGAPTHESKISDLRHGFMLFNLNNKEPKFLDKQSIIEFVNNPNVSEEEKEYFLNIYLQTNKPSFLTKSEIERFRATCHF